MDKNSVNQSQEHSGGEAELSPRPAPEYLSVPSKFYARLGQGYVDLEQQLQALWDAVYLTHPNKERLLRAYVQRIDRLRGGASPMLMDTALELEQLAQSLNEPERETESDQAGT